MRFVLLHSPTWVLILPGSLLWLASMPFLALLALGEVRVGVRVINIHTMLVAGLLNVASLQFLSLGLLAKAYAHVSGLRRDALIAWFYRTFTFERLILYTLPIAAAGLFFALRIVARWMEGGFGRLDEAKGLLFGVLLLIDGLQIWTTGYLLSIMALPRPTTTRPPQP